jgi:hypothetical protein
VVKSYVLKIQGNQSMEATKTHKLTDAQELALVTSLRKYDERQAKGRAYNPYAFAHYCRALQIVRAHVAEGHDVRTAILNAFVGTLANRLIKALKLEPMSKAELMGYGFQKLPEVDID